MLQRSFCNIHVRKITTWTPAIRECYMSTTSQFSQKEILKKERDYTVKFEFLHSLRTFREFGNIRPSLLHGIDPICMEVCLFQKVPSRPSWFISCCLCAVFRHLDLNLNVPAAKLTDLLARRPVLNCTGNFCSLSRKISWEEVTPMSPFKRLSRGLDYLLMTQPSLHIPSLKGLH